MAEPFSTSINFLPPTTNHWLVASGPIALYNPTLVTIANALSQHAIIFGIFFALRGFSAKRVFDLHYIILLLALTLSLAGLVFLVDTALDNYKVFFLLEHEAVEGVLALRVLLPAKVCRNHPALILFFLWTGLCIISVIISLNEFYGHAADLVAWGAFCTDFSIAIAGIKLVRKWYWLRPELATTSSIFRTKIRAEALAGAGCIIHGFTTMCIGPIFMRVLYHNANPNWFAYGFAFVFAFAIFSIGFMVPVISMFFSTINCCCWHNRKVLPGQAQWIEAEDEEYETRDQSPDRKHRFRPTARDVEESA